MVKVGDTAPDFAAQDQDGNQVKLADFAGKRVVLWFYPKADTPGCTREGCGFRDFHGDFEAKNAVILGASYDTPAENKAFLDKFSFPYRLLSDTEKTIAKAYGAFNPQSPDHPTRNTYVIGADGKLEQVHEAVNAKTHPKSLLDSL